MLTETYFPSQREALEGAAKLRASSKEGDVIVKIDASPYGGYRLRMIPTEIAIDMVDYMPSFLCRR